MAWWIWILMGIALSFAEVALTPGVFVFLFFGISSFVVGILVGIGLGGPFWLQVGICSVVALALLAIFRQRACRLMGVRGGKMDMDIMVGGMALACGEMAPGAKGKVEFRGSSWNAVNTGASALHPGDQCRIEKIDGLQLSVVVDNKGA